MAKDQVEEGSKESVEQPVKPQPVPGVKPPMKFFIFREDCFEQYMKYEFKDMDCLKFTISKGIGFAIVVGSSIVKLPQIIKILQKSSVEGISQFTLYIEVSR